MIFEKQVLKQYKGRAFTRYDDTGRAFYFSADDFPGLQKEDYCFTASAGHEMKGYLYHYDQPIPGRLVIFDHSLGGGAEKGANDGTAEGRFCGLFRLEPHDGTG